VDEGTLEAWLAAYGHAWENRDPEVAAELFTGGATYHETSFDEPMVGRTEIVEYWSEVPSSQVDVSFTYEILAATKSEGIAHWRANFVRVPSRVPVKLNDGGLCEEFREWWHKQE
jgi:hypothetical protein